MTPSRNPSILQILSRFMSNILKLGTYPIQTILRRLFGLKKNWAVLWRFIFRSNLNRPTPPKHPGPPSSSKPGDYNALEQDEWGAGSHQSKMKSIGVDFAYTLSDDGETFSLDGVAPSAFPFPGSSIRSANRSTQNLRLRASRLTHERNVSESRDGSQNNTRCHSPASNTTSSYASSVHTRSDISMPDVNTIAVDPPDRPDSSATHLDVVTSRFGRSPSPSRRGKLILDLNVDIPLGLINSRDSQSVTANNDATPLHEEPLSMWLKCPDISAVMPAETKRYEKRPTISNELFNVTIDPLTTSFKEALPGGGWSRHAHPEGALYFFHEEKGVYTDAYLFDNQIFTKAMSDIEVIETVLFRANLPLPEKRHLYIDVNYVYEDEQKRLTTDYYFVDHETRTIFFVEPFEAEDMDSWYESKGCNSRNRLGYEMEAQYWYFVNLFPDSIILSGPLISELRDLAHHFIGVGEDSVTSPQSIAPFTLEYLEKILGWTNSMEKNLPQGNSSIGTSSLLARLLYSFAHARFLHFHGEAHARLERDNSVYGDSTNDRTFFIRSVSWFLFWAPYVHLRTLQKMWVDEIMHKSVWEESVKKMNEEWQEFVLFGTVLLNANVGFLAIQSVDADKPSRTAVQIFSYLSVVASVGSVLLGLLLIRQNRNKIRETADEMQKYLSRKNHKLWGLETLAILFSLPYALLMWAVTLFVTAFCLHCFLDTSTLTRSCVGAACSVVAVLIFLNVWNAWESQPESNAAPGGSGGYFQAATRMTRGLSVPMITLRQATISLFQRHSTSDSIFPPAENV